MDKDNNSTVSSSSSSTDSNEEVSLTEEELEKLIHLFRKDIHRNYGLFISLDYKKKKRNDIQSVSNKKCSINQQHNNNINLTVNKNKKICKPTDIPKYSNQFFGRNKESERIYQILTDNKLAIVTGIEGIGKTEFTKYFIEKYYENFDDVEWVNGATKEKFEQSIAYITDKHSINNNVKEFLQYFNKKNVLFIIDNAYDNIHYRHYFPKTSNMHVLITTVYPDLKQKKFIFRLSKLTDDETIDILHSIFLDSFSTSDEYDWQIFSNYFENIPLALQLSGSCLHEEMIKNDDLRVEHYFKDLQKKKYSLKDDSLTDEYNKVYFSFKLSVETMISSEKQSQLALDILNTCVYLDDDYISSQVLLGHEKVESKQKLNDILEILKKYKLITIEIKQHSNEIHIHSLVRRMLLLDQKEDGTSEHYFKMALALLCIMGLFNIKHILNFAMEHIKVFIQFFFDNNLFDILDPIVENGHDNILGYILKALPEPKTIIDNRNLLFKAIDFEQTKTVKVLLDNGANVFRITTKMRGPLHKASKKLAVSIMALLLTAGTDANIEDYKKNTPMHTVAGIGYQELQNEERTLQCIRVLMKHGANINEMNLEGNTPLDLALQNKAFKVALFILDQLPSNLRIYNPKTIRKILLWDISSDSEETQAYKIIKSLLLKGANKNDIDAEGRNLLIWAVENKCERITEFLLDDCSFRVDFQDNKGQTALHKILKQNIINKKQAQSTVSIIRILLDHKARTNIIDNYGLTAYDICMKKGNVKLCLFIQFLVDELPDCTKKKTYYLPERNLSRPASSSRNWHSENKNTAPYRNSISRQEVSAVSDHTNYAIDGYLSNINTAAKLYTPPTNSLPGPSSNNLLN